MPTLLADVRASLPGLMLRDQRRLGRRADRAAALRDPAARERALGGLQAEAVAAAAAIADRRRSVPVLSYPAELPVSQLREEIGALIAAHQVVIVAGETGSGKTTQLPKICLELGRGIAGQIGHTQPRRIAARTIAERIAAELGTELGGAVGYKVRFADTSSDRTLVKVMTDGILLTELQRDRDLLGYDTLIIDEAHERSLNIDFILGYLHQLLPRRPDLKVIITSATIDTDRLSAHFGEPGRPAPVIEVSGRTYPVEVRYRPLGEPAGQGEQPPGRGDRDREPRDQVQAISDAVSELRADGPGDILVFLSGEREIRDTADALAGLPPRAGQGLDVLPLYARLPAADQHRVFAAHRGQRVVLATNIAETSLTVPGIHYVIDAGTARISRYSQRTKVQRLPIEPVSRASADQRAGRCGRTADGICIRLYSEEDYAARPQYTEPEILRTSLASVVLQMAALDLGDVADFPFVDRPDSRQVSDGVRLLEELGALQPGRPGRPRLTQAGRKLARLPADPRLGRMILAADEAGCTREVLIITAALSIQDPRERPADAREAADARHARFAEPGSDFLTFLRLWDYLGEQQRALSGSAFRRMCRREYLHYLRVREWQDVHGQLRQAARELGITAGQDQRTAGAGQPAAEPGDHEPRFSAEAARSVHTALLAGLLSQIGMKDSGETKKQGAGPVARRRGPAEFTGARGARFSIFPDSALARRPPQWVMAAELVETSRLWARITARIEPEWAEPVAAHLVRRSYSEPRWDAGRGEAVASEKVTLYGLPIVAARTVSLGRVDARLARELFLRHALVEGDWQSRHEFFRRNQALLSEAAELEQRARRRGLVADDTAVFAFYDSRIPAEVTSARHFDAWWKQARAQAPGLLTMSEADLAGPAADEVSAADYPDSWHGLPLSYEFEPGQSDDGVTVGIPLASLSQVPAEEFGWQVPGLRAELVTELIRSLPKQLRTAFVPAPDTARAVLASLGEPHGDLLDALSAELGRIGGVTIPRSAWNLSRLPGHLQVNFRVTSDDGKTLAEGKDVAGLREQLRPRLHAALSEAAAGLTRTGLRGWDIGTLPRVFRAGQVTGYPALADHGDSAAVELFETEAEAAASMLRGTRRLILLQVPSGVRAVARRLPSSTKLAMSRHPYPSVSAMLDDCAACAADQVILDAGGPAWDEGGFALLLAAARERLAVTAADVLGAAARVLTAAQQAESRLEAATSPAMAAAADDIRGQLAGLIYPGFISETGAGRLGDEVRYLQAIVRRLERTPWDPARDAERTAAVHRMADAWRQAMDRLPSAARSAEPARSVRWMIEELRVSLFAPALGTARPVSEKRILAALDALAAA
ncbi:MAG TPA: ATP-dependent RNA helicase HrpA [Streptosporangiaceae bacterium]